MGDGSWGRARAGTRRVGAGCMFLTRTGGRQMMNVENENADTQKRKLGAGSWKLGTRSRGGLTARARTDLQTPSSDLRPAHRASAARAIDKAFRIAKPMRKASWTKCFAAGGRSVRGQIGTESAEGAVGAKGRRDREANSLPCAQHEDIRVRIRFRTRLKGRSGCFTSRTRHDYGTP